MTQTAVLSPPAQAAAIERRIPDATYRLQFNRGFTFRDARAVVAYLADLGVSDVYASPYFRARADSTHGYDIADHNSLNPAIGTEAQYAAFIRALDDRGMGQLLDFVPNHMGIGEPANAWWMDVLENGPASLYADYFDIDWRPLKPELRDKVLLPILGDQYGVVLENGELTLEYGDGSFSVRYWDHRLPVAPRSIIPLLERALAEVVAELGAEHDYALELQSIITGLGYLPPPIATTRERRLERAREKEILRRRLAALHATSRETRRAIDATIIVYNGTTGDPVSFDLLDQLLQAQAYRLSYWRTAGEEINYRRFFDVNDLAGLRMENPAVFEASHRLLFRLLREGAVTGIRIDHPDGLWDPAGYVRRLQERYLSEVGQWAMGNGQSEAEPAPGPTQHSDSPLPIAHCPSPAHASRPLYLVVEKILSGRERLPERWPVDGTTGYEFANAVNGIFVERRNQRAFDAIYDGFTRTDIEFRDLTYQQKRLVLRTALASELNVLAYQLNGITELSRRHRDFTLNGLRTALREVIACFPVYRTYITGEGRIDPQDRAVIDAAIARARRLNPAMEPTIFSFIRDVLLLQLDGTRFPDPRAELDFVMKFQQVTGPVMAKGLEDTAFYIYNRLVSLNEVGGEPEQFGTTVTAFHRHNAERAERWPHSMLTTSTHDTKRSEDVRARINVLSEVPREWSEALERWRALNRPKKAILQDGVAPDRNEEYLLYQTLLGAWPLEPMDRQDYGVFRDRIAAYMLKAIKESKVNTSWINPNHEYDEAVQAFVHAILGETPDNEFVRDMRPLREVVARFGAYNSLSQVLIKLTTPGVPDIYQGNELWDFSLVDPDNRRLVDYKLRRRLLRRLRAGIEESDGDLTPLCGQVLNRWEDGRVKLYLTHRVLTFRREHSALFRDGDYTPLGAQGDGADHVFAFVRRCQGETAIVAAPRLLAGMTPPRGHPLGAATWGDSVLVLAGEPGGVRYRHLFSGATLVSIAHADGAALLLADLFRDFPVALLERVESS